jgi:hypothetical protein
MKLSYGARRTSVFFENSYETTLTKSGSSRFVHAVLIPAMARVLRFAYRAADCARACRITAFPLCCL